MGGAKKGVAKSGRVKAGVVIVIGVLIGRAKVVGVVKKVNAPFVDVGVFKTVGVLERGVFIVVGVVKRGGANVGVIFMVIRGVDVINVGVCVGKWGVVSFMGVFSCKGRKLGVKFDRRDIVGVVWVSGRGKVGWAIGRTRPSAKINVPGPKDGVNIGLDKDRDTF